MSGPGRGLESEDLIEEVRRRPVVYDDRLRKNRTTVESAWIDIGHQLGCDGSYFESCNEGTWIGFFLYCSTLSDGAEAEFNSYQNFDFQCSPVFEILEVLEEASVRIPRPKIDIYNSKEGQTCKLKWHDLRNTYLRRRKREINPSSSSKPHHYFELMRFLDSEASREKDIDDMMERVSKAQNVDSSAKLDAEMADADPSKTAVHRSHFLLSTVGLFPKNINRTDVMDAVTADTIEYDSDLHFFLSLLPLMKQLSPQDNLDIRIQIQSLLKRKLFPDSSN